jgi:hypothetical protein
MAEVNTNLSAAPSDAPESVWTFRGYRMRPGEFNTAMVHFYRFVVINPTEEIWGKGFSNLEPIWKRRPQRVKKAPTQKTGS